MGKMHPLFPEFVEAWKRGDDATKLDVVKYAKWRTGIVEHQVGTCGAAEVPSVHPAPQIRMKRMRPNAIIPTRAHTTDSGLDLRASLDGPIEIAPGRRSMIPVGWAFAIPPGFEGQVRPRSGMASRGIDVHLGTIDSSYTGEVHAIVINNSNAPVFVHHGDKIAQLVIAQVVLSTPVSVVELDETDRGANGFGSTGT